MDIGFNRILTVCITTGIGLVGMARADVYPRQEGVDARHYAFSVKISDTTDEFVGETTATIGFTKDGVGQVAFDLMSAANGRGMTVGSVGAVSPRGDVSPVKFAHEKDKLVVNLPQPAKAGETMAFVIDYHGVPGPGMHVGMNRDGEKCYFSENWPDRARQWLPCIDHPYDKATSEFIITAPAKYQVVANGLLVDVVKNADGTNKTHWKQSVPIATWLNAIGVADFAEHDGEKLRGGVPLQTWVFPEEKGFTAGMEDSAKKAFEFYSDYVGPYPYEKLANVQAFGIGGGTEHASAIFYGQNNLNASGPFPLMAHEIAHQWFGCSVTEKDWDDVWLSEGFATYFALLATEKYQGHEAFITGVKRARDTVLATERRMPGEAVIHVNLADMRRVLNQLVYQKGAWFLHMLRGRIGDEAFQKGLRAYYAKYRDKNAATDDLRAEMEAASGEKLEWFFTQWLKRPGSPVVEGTWAFDEAGKKIVVDLAQVQEGEAFRLPFEVGVRAEAGGEMKISNVEMTEKKARLEIAAEKQPAEVVLDPNTWVLMAGKFGKK